MENANIAHLKVTFEDLVRRWISFTHPFHNLTQQEQDILTMLLIYYFKFKKSIDEETIVWKMVFDYDTRLEMKDRLDIKDYTLQNVLTRLRSKGIVKKNRVVKAYIPNVSMDSKNFKLVYSFEIV